MKKSILAAFIFVLISSALFSCNQTAPETRNTIINQVGDHQIVIVSTSSGSTSNSTRNNDSLSFDDGSTNILFKDEILTVNGKKYRVPNKSDSIYVENNDVKINDKKVYPIN
jgi:archaellum component FlaF (FlaF/FlaG flagellin family)